MAARSGRHRGGSSGKRGGARPGTGGARPGAGRPPNSKLRQVPIELGVDVGVDDGTSIAWTQVAEYAYAGVAERTILEALGLDENKLRAAGVLDRFRTIVTTGHARCKADLAVEIKARSERTKKNAGSVNALQLRARNQLDWDKQNLLEEAEPDLASAKEQLLQELEQLAVNKSQLLDRPVSPADCIFQDLYGRWPWEPEPPAADVVAEVAAADKS